MFSNNGVTKNNYLCAINQYILKFYSQLNVKFFIFQIDYFSTINKNLLKYSDTFVIVHSNHIFNLV